MAGDDENAESSPFLNLPPHLQEMLKNTRFAVPDRPPSEAHPEELNDDDDEEYSHNDLEKLRHFRPSHFNELFEQQRASTSIFEFFVSNVNFEKGLILCVSKTCITLQLQEDTLLEAKVGTVFRVYDANNQVKSTVDEDTDQLLANFTVKKFQKQVMLRKETLNILQ
jgi:hypothetical protein